MRTLKHKPLPKSARTPVLEALYVALNPEGEATRIVGGAVRDWLVKKPLGDIDLTTTMLPAKTKALAEKAGFKVIPTGLAHGTVMAVKNGEHYEITTLRHDVETDGRHAKVTFTRDFAEDAKRRDFTFNTLYMDWDGNITDYTGGIDDLNAGIVRFVGNPAQRLEEDYLRLMRYFRFWSRFGQKAPDDETSAALKAATVGINKLSAERITEEMMKLLKTERALEALNLMRQHQVLDALNLGHMDLPALARFRQRHETAKPLACLQAAMWHHTDRDPLTHNPHFVFSNAERDWLKLTSRNRFRDIYLQNISLSAALVGGEEPLHDLVNLACANGLLPDETQVENVKTFAVTGATLMKRGMAAGKELGQHLRRLKYWWLGNGCPSQELTLLASDKLQQTPERPILVIPDLHGELELLKRLQASALWNDASSIIFLGDYLDGHHEGGYVETAQLIYDAVRLDPRVILLRANHEQLNERRFKQALANPDMPIDEAVGVNMHNQRMMDELNALPKEEAYAFMQRVRHIYRDHAVDAARIKLASGKTLLFTHGGYHPDLLAQGRLTARVADGVEIEILQVSREVKNAIFWGAALAAPDEQLPEEYRHLFAPPKAVEIIVGHHFSRRRNLLPEHQANITFMDTGGGKGGQLSLLTIHPVTGERHYYTDTGHEFAEIDVPHRKHVVPHIRNLLGAAKALAAAAGQKEDI